MQKKIKLSTVVLLALLNFAVLKGSEDNIGSNFRTIPPDQIPDILTMISNETQSNYDMIKTWQGKIDVTTKIIYEGTEAEKVFKKKVNSEGNSPHKIEKQRESTVEFAANFENHSFYAKKYYRKALKYIEPNSGEVLNSMLVDKHNISICTLDYKIISRVSAKKGDSLTYTAIKEEMISQEDCISYKRDVFDPRSDVIDGMAFQQTFLVLLNYIEKNGEFNIRGHSLDIEEQIVGNSVEYHLEIPSPQANPEEFIVTTMVFNSDKGFNITSSETRGVNGKLYQKVIWEYEFINDVYLPIRMKTQNYSGEEASLADERECVFTNSKLNQAISEDTFSYQNLGLKNGDLFVDKILNKRYIYKDGSLVMENNQK